MMKKYTILFGCGHIADVEVDGTDYEQTEKLAYLKICGRCPECEAKHRAKKAGAEEA